MSIVVPETLTFLYCVWALAGFVAVAIVFVEGRLYSLSGTPNLGRANRGYF